MMSDCELLNSTYLSSQTMFNGELLNKYINIKAIDFSQLTRLTAIHSEFLKNCTSLETLILPQSIEIIYSAFLRGCRNIKTLNLSQLTKLTDIHENFLIGCTSLETLILPSNIEYISWSFLGGCINIKELDL
jgi:hypothetical protein